MQVSTLLTLSLVGMALILLLVAAVGADKLKAAVMAWVALP